MNRAINLKIDPLQRRKDCFARSLAFSTQTVLAELEGSPDLPQSMGYFINIMRDVFVDGRKERLFPSTGFQGANHKKVIGTYCMMVVPEELIYAAGAIPVRLCGGSHEATSIGDELVSRDTCPVVKASVGFTSRESDPLGRKDHEA